MEPLGSDNQAPNWQELEDSSLGAESPELYLSPSIVAGDGLLAVLGHDLSLLRLYKVGAGSAKCIQGYSSSMDPNPSSPERMRQLFWQGQSSSKRTSGWGLRVNLNDKIDGPQSTRRGFVDWAWPSQSFQIDSPVGDDLHVSQKTTSYIQKATSYIQDGRLIQAIAIICDKDSTDISWEVGGEVQMWNDFPNTPTTAPNTRHTTNYTANVWTLEKLDKPNKKLSRRRPKNEEPEIQVLTVDGESHVRDEETDLELDTEGIICMDVAVFLNRKSQGFGDFDPIETQNSVNFTGGCGKIPIKLAQQRGQCFVAVFSLRDKNQECKPETMLCPPWSELRARLGIKKIGDEKVRSSGPSRLNLHAALMEQPGISQLDAIPDIITRTVEQLCSVLIYSEPKVEDTNDSLFSVEPPETIGSSGQVNGIHDHKTGDHQSIVSIANNLGIEPGLGQLIHEPYFWHIRLLSQVATILKSQERQNENPRKGLKNANDIKYILSRSISRYLFQALKKSNLLGGGILLGYRAAVAEFQAFLVMSLFSAGSCIDLKSLPEENIEGYILPIQIEAVPGEEKSLDPVFRLLQWCHRRILMDDKFKEMFSKKPWLRNYLITNKDTREIELERYRDGALRPLLIPSEIDILSGKGDATDIVFSNLAREEKWMQLALLQVEFFSDNDDESLHLFLSKLVDQVSKRLKRRATAFVGYLPPWGYRCLDHLLEMDLAVAKKKLKHSREDLQNKIQSSYENCRYFLKSDLSFFGSRNTADPSWVYEHWGMDLSSSICSSFLQAVTLLQKDSRDGHDPAAVLRTIEHQDLGNISFVISSPEAAHDVFPSLQNSTFPWKHNLVDQAYHPQFMSISLRIRDGERDRESLGGWMKALKTREKTHPLVSHFEDLASLVPNKWKEDDLDIEEGEAWVVDFPSRRQSHSKADVLKLFMENRVDQDAAYRIIAVNTLGRPKLVNTYLHFAHEDAWDGVVDFFGSVSLFRGFTDILHEDTKELSWRMSINISHIMLQSRTESDAIDRSSDSWKPLKYETPEGYDDDKSVLRDACSTICTTGDRLGEFWTCSFLGPLFTPEKDQNKTPQSPAHNGGRPQGQAQQAPNNAPVRQDGENKPLPVFDVERVTKINQRYIFDKYSARNLVFIVQLTRLIWILSASYENVAQYLKHVMELDKSEQLYGDIASPEFAKSGAEKAMAVTNTLRRILWGIEWLQKLEWSIKSAEIAINEAIIFVEKNVSKRRQYWHPKLEEFEQEQVWGESRRALSRMKACRHIVETIDRKATGIKDNLISITNMSSTKAILMTTADTSRMKIISILTAVFLPFTIVAIVLTIPMFEWPKAEDGKIIVSLPFKIFWATSVPLGAVIGILMVLISKCEKRDWKVPSLRKPSPAGSRAESDSPGSGSSSATRRPAASPVRSFTRRIRSQKPEKDIEKDQGELYQRELDVVK